MKLKLFAFFLILTVILGCSKNDQDIHSANTSLTYTISKDSQSVNPSIRGTWKSIGNGYYLEARTDSILVYSYTTSYCYKEKNDYLEGFAMMMDALPKKVKEKTLTILSLIIKASRDSQSPTLQACVVQQKQQ